MNVLQIALIFPPKRSESSSNEYSQRISGRHSFLPSCRDHSCRSCQSHRRSRSRSGCAGHRDHPDCRKYPARTAASHRVRSRRADFAAAEDQSSDSRQSQDDQEDLEMGHQQPWSRRRASRDRFRWSCRIAVAASKTAGCTGCSGLGSRMANDQSCHCQPCCRSQLQFDCLLERTPSDRSRSDYPQDQALDAHAHSSRQNCRHSLETMTVDRTKSERACHIHGAQAHHHHSYCVRMDRRHTHLRLGCRDIGSCSSRSKDCCNSFDKNRMGVGLQHVLVEFAD